MSTVTPDAEGRSCTEPASCDTPAEHTDSGRFAGEYGYVMVMLTLSMVLLLAFAGYSVDVGNWNLHKNEVRTVAEASALGGVAFLPDDYAEAKATAEQIAIVQGFDISEIDVQPGSAPNRLKVTITRTIDNYFVRVLGMNSKTITDTAVAEFEQPVAMGSPNIILGNDPETGWSPDYWLSIAGRNVDKAQGDRFAPARCWTPGTAYCGGINNLEHDSFGYAYTVGVTDTTQPLRIQVFDPAWTWTGSSCEIPTWPTAAQIAALKASDDGSDPSIPFDYYADADVRYASGPGAYCTGDDRSGSNGPATSFRIRLPDDSPWDDTNNSTVWAPKCQPVTLPAYEPTSIYQAPTQSIYQLLQPGGDNEWKINPNDGLTTFAEVFRRWVTICEIDPGPWLVQGDYIVQVSSNWTGGQNRFSLRAGPPSGSTVSDIGQSLYSRTRLPIFANANNSDTTFFLARVPPSSDERLLRVTFFDIGDASAPGTLTIVPPIDSGVAAFPDCDFTLGGVPLASTSCQIGGVYASSGFDGQVVQALVTIPAIADPTNPYDCDLTNPDNCWVTVRAQFAGGITDATTWTAELIGDAVRIIPE